MKLTVSTTEKHTGDVDIQEVWGVLKRELEKDFPGSYINSNGMWEVDFGGHGSGYQEERGTPTKEELKLVKALEVVTKAIKTRQLKNA